MNATENEIESSDREQPDRRGDRQSRQDRDHDRDHQPRGAHREPQGRDHRQKHDDGDDADILRERGEFLIGQRHLTCHSHLDTVGAIEIQFACHGRDRRCRRLTRHQRRMIENRLHQNQFARASL